MGAPYFFKRPVVTPEPSLSSTTGKCPIDWGGIIISCHWHRSVAHFCRACIRAIFQCSFQSHGAKCTLVCKVVLKNPVQQIAEDALSYCRLLYCTRRCDSLSINKTRAVRTICIAQEHFHIHLTQHPLSTRIEMIFKVSLTQMSARACLSPFKPFSHKKEEGGRQGCPVWTRGACSLHFAHSWSFTHWERRVWRGWAPSLRLDVWQDQPLTWYVSHVSHPLFRKTRAADQPTLTVKPRRVKTPSGGVCLHSPYTAAYCCSAAMCTEQQRGWPQTLLTHWLTGLVARRQLTDNPNFYYSSRDQSTGPKIRHVPAPWTVSCYARTEPQHARYCTICSL